MVRKKDIYNRSESTTEGGRGVIDGSTEAEGGGETAKRKGHYRRLQ